VNPPELEDLLRSSDISADSLSSQRMLRYYSLLVKWNRRINLVSATSWKILGPFFEEAIWASRFFRFQAPDHLDIGSGAGFPAIPFRIMVPGMRLRMVESRSKKALFLETAIRELALENCSVSCLRLREFLDKERRPGWGTVSWKGLRLNSRDLDMLLACSGGETDFWMFHGQSPPLEAPGILEERFRLRCREVIPGRKDSFLSIYRKRE
jgi:16S rRNA (guanine(527)-N(7))-methyltransferase RsmG